MLITHVQAYTSVGEAIHVQATGPAFPTGYTSCDLNDKDAVAAVKAQETATSKRFGSFRPGSGAQYVLLTVEGGDVFAGENIVCSLQTLVESLDAPSPAYKTDATDKVTANVATRVEESKRVDPTPTKDDKSSEISAIRDEVRNLLNRLDALLDD